MAVKVWCLSCDWTGTPEECKASMSAYHDLKCPGCGSTDIDTHEILEDDPSYGFGSHNVLDMTKRIEE